MRADWYRFWSWGAWRDWLDDRRRVHDHKATVASLRREIEGARNLVASSLDARADAIRNARWVSDLRPKGLPLLLPESEIGLASVPGVHLLEHHDGSWVDADTGVVYFTDQRIVFSGSTDLTFRFGEITVDEQVPEGWRIGVSSHSKTYVLAGPVEQLKALRSGVLDGRAAVDPMDRFRRDWSEAEARADAARDRLRAAEAELASSRSPRRPVSPAWSLAVALAGLGLVGVAGSPSATAPVVIEAAASRPAPQVLGVTVTTLAGTSVRLVEVVSADELLIEMDGDRQTIRLAGIATDDRTEPSTRQAIREMVLDRTITLAPEPADGPMSYYVYADGDLVNERLIEDGLVTANAVALRLADLLQEAEDRARAARIGVWAPDEAETGTSRVATFADVTVAESACHPSYEGQCVPVDVEDVDCAGGDGNGPFYVGRVTVVGPDEYGLDGDGDGIGCAA